MKKFLLMAVMVVGLTGAAMAAVVVYKAGVQQGAVEKIDLAGSSVTVRGKTATVSNRVSALDVDTALYAKTTPGAGAARILRVSVDGTIYASN